MNILIVIAKILAGVAIAVLGYILLDTTRWSLLPLEIPVAYFDMRLERLWVGGTVLLLGGLCALSALVGAVIPSRRA